MTRWLLNTNNSFTSIKSHLREQKMHRQTWPMPSRVIILANSSVIMATQSVVCKRVARQANLNIFPPRIGMVSLTGHGLNIIGESNVCFTFDGLRHETAILVASDLGGDSMLVAWHDL